MAAYYNEIDPYAAQWLRNLIAAKLIADGEVDERSITDVSGDDLQGFSQCHFFAGIGVWSYALRQAGWPDDKPVWTGSCPCQPFSSAGRRQATEDERHLWPAWYKLINERNPIMVFGEQVASKDGYGWLDLVQTDLEKMAYTCGAVVLPAAGLGAPHGRHRIFFMANAVQPGWAKRWAVTRDRSITGGGSSSLLANTDNAIQNRESPSREQPLCGQRRTSTCSLVNTESKQARISRFARERRATGGHWGDADWIPCRGAKWRPIEPGTFPLAHGIANRMDKLRAYGNAISPQAAAAFIEASVAEISSLKNALSTSQQQTGEN